MTTRSSLDRFVGYVKRPLKILMLLALTLAIGYVGIRIISASSSVDRLSLGFLVGFVSLFFIFSLLAAVDEITGNKKSFQRFKRPFILIAFALFLAYVDIWLIFAPNLSGYGSKELGVSMTSIFLLILISLGLMEIKGRNRHIRRQEGNLIMFAAMLLSGGISVYLIMEAWKKGIYESLWWELILLSLLFLPTMLYSLSLTVEVILGHKIKASKENTVDEIPSPSAESSDLLEDSKSSENGRVSQPPPFAVEIFDANNLPTSSPKASAFLGLARDRFNQYVLIFKRGTFILLIENIVVAFVGIILGIENPLVSWIFSFPAIVSIAASLIILKVKGDHRSISTARYMARGYTTRQYGLWGLANIALFGYLIIQAASYIFKLRAAEGAPTTAGMIVFMAVVFLFIYFQWMKHDVRMFKQTIAGHPLNLLYLWVFGSSGSEQSLSIGIGLLWRFLGSVQRLKGIGANYQNEILPVLKGKGNEVIVKTPEEATRRINAFKMEPDRYGLYPVNELLCTDSVWKLAFNKLLKDTDLALMDLSDFSPENRGSIYEIGRLLDDLPTDRFLLIADQRTDMGFLQDTLSQSWENMSAKSPNRRMDAGPVRIYKVQHEESGGDRSGHKGDDLERENKDANCIQEILLLGVTGSQPAKEHSNDRLTSDRLPQTET